MRKPLVIAVAQPPCVPYDVAGNSAIHAAAVWAADARIVVFPEMSITGYEPDAPAIEAGDPRLRPLVEACSDTGSMALIGAPVRGEGGRSHIAVLAVDGSGASVVYRKLYPAETESERFSPGEAPAVLEVDGWRLGLAICRDTGIAEHVAATAALGIDAYVAGTLMSPEERGIQDERSRRIAAERHVWVAVSSFAGPTGAGYDESAGCSGIWAPDGRVAAQAGPEAGAIARTTLT